MLRDVVRFVSVVAIFQVAFFQMFFSRLCRVKFKFVFTLFLFSKKKSQQFSCCSVCVFFRHSGCISRFKSLDWFLIFKIVSFRLF